jgi:two-component system response regulator YesN
VDSYKEAINAMRNEKNKIVHYKDLPLSSIYEKDYPVEIEEALFANIEQGKLLDAQNEADKYFTWMVQNYSHLEKNIKLKVLEFILYAERKAYLNGGMTYSFENRQDYLDTINNISSFEELKKWFIDKIVEACTNIITKKKEHSNKCIEKAKDYIQKNYKRDISLEEVSKYVDISLYYFSKLFKDVVGENFIDYLTNIRIEKAKELLVTDMNIKEVAIEVGYKDSNYFSRIFKKCVGVTPSEYREGYL